MFSVQSAANGTPPPPPPPAPLIPNFWDALPWFSDGAAAGSGCGAVAWTRGGASGCDGGSNRSKNSSRLLGCFISLPLTLPLPLSSSSSWSSSSAMEDRSTRRRRPRNRNRSSNVECRGTIRSVGSRLLKASSSSSSTATADASPEVLPEWLGKLGLDKEEEEGLMAAFAALPDLPPPAEADARLVQAAKDLVVSIKKPEPGRPVPIEASGLLKGMAIVDVKGKMKNKEKRVRAVPSASKNVPLNATKGEPLELPEGGGGDGGSVDEVKAAWAALETKEPRASSKRTVREPLTGEEEKTRDRWLKERLCLDSAALTRMKEIFSQVLKCRNRDDLEPKLDWLQERLDLDDGALGKMVAAAPYILRLDIETSLKPKMEWIKTKLGLDRKASAKLVLSVPSILNIQEERLERKLDFLRGEGVNLSKIQVKRIIRNIPSVLTFSIEENMLPKLAWLRERMGLDDDGIRKVVGRNPRVFALKVETIEGKLMWLEGRLGIDRDKAVRVVMTFPLILSMGLETMDWKIVWLQQRLGLTKDQMTALIVKYPNLLSYNIEDNIEPTLKWLEEGLGVDAGVAGKLVLRQPRLLSASLEDNLKKKVPWLMKNLHLSREAVLQIVTGCPDLLNLSTERNLGPTIQFFYDEMGASKEEVSAMAVSNSRGLTYSLEKRWKARAARIREKGVTLRFRDHWKPIANRVPDKFDAWLERLSPDGSKD